MNGQRFYSQEKRAAYLMGLTKRGEISTTYKLDETVTGDLGEQAVSIKLYVNDKLMASETYPLNSCEGVLRKVVSQLDNACGHTVFDI